MFYKTLTQRNNMIKPLYNIGYIYNDEAKLRLPNNADIISKINEIIEVINKLTPASQDKE